MSKERGKCLSIVEICKYRIHNGNRGVGGRRDFERVNDFYMVTYYLFEMIVAWYADLRTPKEKLQIKQFCYCYESLFICYLCIVFERNGP